MAPTAPAADLQFDLVDTFGPDGTGATEFGKAVSLAVDQNADLIYVLDREADALFKFDLEGNPVDFGGSSPQVSGNELSGLAIGAFRGERQVAVDSETHTVYLTGVSDGYATAIQAFRSNGEPAIFSAGPDPGTNEISGFSALEGIAIDSDGMIYATNWAFPTRLQVYRPSGEPLVDFEPALTGFANLAVDSNGTLYATRTGLEVSRFLPSESPVAPGTIYTADLQPFDGNEAISVAVDPATDEVYVVEAGPVARIAVFESDGSLRGTFGGPGEAGELDDPESVAVHGGTERVFVADSHEDVSRVKIFEPQRCICPPAVESTSASGVSGDSVSLRAEINPNTLATNYWFEYGPADCSLDSCTKVPLPGATIAAGFKAVTVTQPLAGLQAATRYHYRVLAENEHGVTEGPDHTFTTQGSGLGFRLADARVWELVSPPHKNGGQLLSSSVGIIQASADGQGLAYLSLGSIEASPEGNRAIELSSVLARRSTAAWSSKDITPPHTALTSFDLAEYLLMSPDLGRSLLEARDSTPLSPLTTERTSYLRENVDPPLYTPLLTGAAGHANVPPGTEFDDVNLDVMGANRDLSAVVLRSSVPLLDAAPEFAIYLWRGGELQALSQRPPSEVGAILPGSLGSNLGSVRNAVSDDGTRVFWAPGNSYGGPGLYLRDAVARETVRLDVALGGAKGGGPPDPAFQIAATDGTIVFFSDSRHLTKDASPEGRDLYRCEIPAGESLSGCADLTDISAPRKGSGESANVKDQVLAASDDGSRVYFVATGVLDIEPNDQGDSATAEQPNLYLWQQGAGVRFITTLEAEDSLDWGSTPELPRGYAGLIAADGSPSGRYLAFTSARSLTGYDNREAKSAAATQQAYRYDAASGELTCVSCSPTEGRPRAKLMSADFDAAADPQGLWSNRWMAALMPEARAEGFGDSLYRPRTALDNGRVFFNAFDSLVPADSNGTWDVYQYESTGTGSCTLESGDAATARSGDGCVSLISSGTAEEEAAFLDASLTGDDVFFLSTAKLSALDEDTVYDVYDARVNGVAAQLPNLSECQGEACRPQVSAPDDPTPASAGFRGAGDVEEPPAKHCPKGKRKVRRKGKVRCARKHKHRQRRPGKHRPRHSSRLAG